VTTDVLTPEQRRRCMKAIRGRDTKPELVVRAALDQVGRAYVLGGAGLPGRPDVVFPGLRRAIFVNGCFWHRHRCRYGRVVPKTNPDFWSAKRDRTVERDRSARRRLRRLGWAVLVVWECKTRRSATDVERALSAFVAVRQVRAVAASGRPALPRASR
jgi:DNA mismatch endonuclease, patch repair protein